MVLLLLLVGWVASVAGQPAERFVLGTGGHSWASGGGGREPTVLVKRLGRTAEDTTNAPGDAVDWARRPGWIGPRFFAGEENVSVRVLEGEGSVRVENAFYNPEVGDQLTGMVNGNHAVAFERKPTPFNPAIAIRDVWVILDFGLPIGVHRVRFYPRNAVAATPAYPFQDDFLRGYEVWLNRVLTADDAPDLLVAREAGVETPVADIEVRPQYARLVKVRSLVNTPFEIDEIEVYGTGYLEQAAYISDILDLGERATVGPLSWMGRVVGDSLFSSLSVRVRTGRDDTPVRYLQRIRGQEKVIEVEVGPEEYYALDPRDRAGLEEDLLAWSPWTVADSGELIGAPVPRRFLQFRLEFQGGLNAAREVSQLRFDFLQPPLADTLWAEVFPRAARAEEPATFRYAVRLRGNGPVRGYDRIEVDTNAMVEGVRAVQVDGRPVEFAVAFVRPDGFGLELPLVRADGALLEFTFDLPIFRFGTTFSGRVYNSRYPDVPQRLQAGNAMWFGPEDVDELSGLFVSIPRQQIGRLVGEIAVARRVVTSNGDGANDRFEIAFNLLQLIGRVPVRLEIFDLAGRRVHEVVAEERGIGPVRWSWDGRLGDGSRVLPGVYVWVLRVEADAFEEVHSGSLAVVY